MKRYFLCMLVCCALIRTNAQAQPTDSVRLTIDKAENIFLQNNLQLLASKYDVDIAKAEIIQASLYNNPTISATGMLYNPVNKKVGDVYSGMGQYETSIQQVVLLAGKRNKQIKLAQANADISEAQFYDLIRTLRYTLRSDFYNIYYLLNSYNVFQKQIDALQKLDANNQELRAKGIVTLKEVLRIQSLLYSLKAGQTNLRNQVNDLQAEVQLLLRNNQQFVIPDVPDNVGKMPTQPLLELVDSAYANRYDLKMATAGVRYSQQDYALQKALAVPDLTLGASFDKRGSNVDNASFLTAAIDLPFFNRNQGRIKAAKIAIDQSKVLLGQQTLQVENDVQKAWQKTIITDKALQEINPQFTADFEKMLQAIGENFQKKNISLLEFVDFNDSYKQNILQMNELRNERMQAIEALNFAIGKPLSN